MRETYVRLLCPECDKAWERPPGDLPDAREEFRCPDCGVERRVAEFARTDRDLENLKRLG